MEKPPIANCVLPMSILRASYRFALTSASTFTSNEVVKSRPIGVNRNRIFRNCPSGTSKAINVGVVSRSVVSGGVSRKSMPTYVSFNRRPCSGNFPSEITMPGLVTFSSPTITSIPTDAIIVSEWNVVPSIPNSSTTIGIANNSRLSPFDSPLFAIAFSLNRFTQASVSSPLCPTNKLSMRTSIGKSAFPFQARNSFPGE